MTERDIKRYFEEVFSSCPRDVYGLVKRALKRYGRTKRGKVRVEMFMHCQGFSVADLRVIRLPGYDEAMYDGSVEVFSCQYIGGDFVPLSVMFIEIDMNKVTIKISSQWQNFHAGLNADDVSYRAHAGSDFDPTVNKKAAERVPPPPSQGGNGWFVK
jgi:hypothetical protein